MCADARTTENPEDPELKAIAALSPRRNTAWPFEYGEARETPRYWSVPSGAEQRRREWRLDDHLANVARLRDGAIGDGVPALLRGVDVSPASAEAPVELAQAPVVHEYRLQIKAGSTISWASQFDAQGRTWLVTPDLALVPKDKVAPFAHSEFHGVKLGDGAALPMVFVRQKPRTRWARSDDGTVREAGQWPRLAHAGLTGRQESSQGRVLLETTEPGAWIERSEATLVSAAASTPWGEPVDGAQGAPGPASRPRPPASSRKTWIEVSVHGGWLIAYEGTRPVFTTLVSPGRGRTLRVGDHEEIESATPPGIFSVQGKYLTSTMAVTDIVHFDVTFAMPFSGTIALHSAYWHDRWGEKASMGCVNLSPIDALWLFRWAEPELPAGWHGVSAFGGSSYATTVVVHA